MILPRQASPFRRDRLRRSNILGSVNDSISVEVKAIEGARRGTSHWHSASYSGAFGVLRQQGLAAPCTAEAYTAPYTQHQAMSTPILDREGADLGVTAVP